jgi:hypothetical protein
VGVAGGRTSRYEELRDRSRGGDTGEGAPATCAGAEVYEKGDIQADAAGDDQIRENSGAQVAMTKRWLWLRAVAAVGLFCDAIHVDSALGHAFSPLC